MEKSKPIDADKLRRALARRNINAQEASRKIGYTKNGIQGAIKNRRISNTMKALLEHVLGIPYEEIKPDEQEQTQPEQMMIKPETAAPQVDLSRVEEMMVTLVKIMQNQDMTFNMVRALNSWWYDVSKEFTKNLKGTIYAATFQALQMHDEKIREERGI